ncbi:hypothetical protein [Leisingera sp. ANG-M1]|nr:hypothetical protein [Leisingera sp. ANG-M1]
MSSISALISVTFAFAGSSICHFRVLTRRRVRQQCVNGERHKRNLN